MTDQPLLIRPTHFVSCYRLPGPCCGSCHDEENEGYGNLYIENADVGPSTVVGVRSCCTMSDKVEERVVKLTARLGGSGRRW